MRKVPKLRFKEFSGEWEENKLEELTTYVDYRGKTPEKVERGILLVTAKNIKMGYIDYNISKEYVAKENYDEIMRRGKVKKGEVLLTTEAPLGNVAQIDDENIALAQRVIKFAGISLKIDNSFLKYRFITEKFQTELKNKAIGTTVLGIQGKVLHKLLIKYPLLQEQEKIANFLSSVDKKISLTEEKLELFREYKKGVMQKIFSQELRFKDSNGNDYPGWKEEKLKNLSKIITKQTGFDYSSTIKPSLITERKPNTLPFIQNKDFKGKYINYNTDFYIPESIQNKFLKITLNEKCILITISGNIGNIGLFDYKELAFIGGAVGVIKLKNISMLEYIYYYLISDKCQRKIISNEKTSAHKNITIEDIRELIVFLPCYEEQEKIADFLSSIDSKIESIEKELDGLKEFKKGLLQQMFV